MQKIVTKNLTLRGIKSKDVFGYLDLVLDGETMELIGGNSTQYIGEFKDFSNTIIEDMDKGFSIFWTITLGKENEFIGFIWLLSLNSRYFDQCFEILGEIRNRPEFLQNIDKNGWEVEYALLKEYRNKGIMTEALSSVQEFCITENLSPLYAKVVNVRNQATIAVLEKLNFFSFSLGVGDVSLLGKFFKWKKDKK